MSQYREWFDRHLSKSIHSELLKSIMVYMRSLMDSIQLYVARKYMYM